MSVGSHHSTSSSTGSLPTATWIEARHRPCRSDFASPWPTCVDIAPSAVAGRTPSVEREGERPCEALRSEPDDGEQLAVTLDDVMGCLRDQAGALHFCNAVGRDATGRSGGLRVVGPARAGWALVSGEGPRDRRSPLDVGRQVRRRRRGGRSWSATRRSPTSRPRTDGASQGSSSPALALGVEGEIRFVMRQLRLAETRDREGVDFH